ncbi:MAG TPA: chromosome partitioning protein ParA, partial [Rhodospirillaceae bacterium]|nr:chromosome partitioning protein ParA [Rhodospirillaceae bacterium]
KPVPALEELQRRLERLRRERETLGAVNLRAEEEAETLQTEIDTLVAERDDLIAAINRLRQGIGKLKSEARNRLLDAFANVDQAFQHLFVTLFGGGRAQLTLTEAEDPLDAGLEIFASPPGKRLQNLSLLSGGEQALTAIALLFAVFQSNPSPICVLDEVDAPLDEANVDRFCTMLDEMVKTDTTRFLVITHHRMTMARMHRLYGVTMGERGVSQLVAVDLDEGARLREAG